MKTTESLLTAVLCVLSQKLQMKHGKKRINPQKVSVTDISRSEALRKDPSGCVFSLNDENLF